MTARVKHKAGERNVEDTILCCSRCDILEAGVLRVILDDGAILLYRNWDKVEMKSDET